MITKHSGHYLLAGVIKINYPNVEVPIDKGISKHIALDKFKTSFDPNFRRNSRVDTVRI
jgi:hypothetical protein